MTEVFKTLPHASVSERWTQNSFFADFPCKCPIGSRCRLCTPAVDERLIATAFRLLIVNNDEFLSTQICTGSYKNVFIISQNVLQTGRGADCRNFP